MKDTAWFVYINNKHCTFAEILLFRILDINKDTQEIQDILTNAEKRNHLKKIFKC